jgi:hypothetical protein
MNFNLSNEEHYCKYWRKYFEELLENQEFIKVDKKENVDIGHYNFATKIAYGFPNSNVKNKSIHRIFKNESFYPNSMLINKQWSIKKENRKKIKEFINNSRKILKNHSNGFSFINNYEDCIKKMNNHDFYILQTIINPILYNDNKITEKIYLLITKENNTYNSYLFKDSLIKIAGFPYSDSEDLGIFSTNINAPKPEGKLPEQFIKETPKYLNHTDFNNEWISKRKNVIEKISDIFLPFLAKNTKDYFIDKNEPKYIYHLFSIDLLIDTELNFYLYKINSKPSIVNEDILPQKITTINYNICERIALNLIFPWIDNKNNSLSREKSITKIKSYEI